MGRYSIWQNVPPFSDGCNVQESWLPNSPFPVLENRTTPPGSTGSALASLTAAVQVTDEPRIAGVVGSHSIAVSDRSLAISSTETVFEVVFATYAVSPSGVIAIIDGSSPTSSGSPSTLLVWVLMIDTVSD